MNFRLPEISSRGRSPTMLKTKTKTSRQISSFSTIKSRIESLSPLRKDSNESILNTRTISDEMHSAKMANSSILTKINTLLIDLDKKYLKKQVKPRLLKNKQKMYKDITKALFPLTNTTKNKLQASAICTLFLSLGYTSDYDSLTKIFRSSFPAESFENISVSKSEILSIFEDSKIDSMLRVMLSEFKYAESLEKNEEFDYLLAIIHRWWIKLDTSKNGFVPTEDVCKFLIKENMFESSVDLRKAFHKLSPFITFQQFFTIFGKSLLKFLLLRLCDDAGENPCLAPDIVINEKRRKVILSGISGQNRAFNALVNFNTLNK